MSKETYTEAFEVWHKSDPLLRGDDYYDVLGFMQDADREIKRLEAENEKQKHNTDAIWDMYQSSKRENAALREKLAAAIEDIKRMDRYIAKSNDPYAALCEVCRHKPEAREKCKRCDVHDNTGFEWRGRQEGEKG